MALRNLLLLGLLAGAMASKSKLFLHCILIGTFINKFGNTDFEIYGTVKGTVCLFLHIYTRAELLFTSLEIRILKFMDQGRELYMFDGDRCTFVEMRLFLDQRCLYSR